MNIEENQNYYSKVLPIIRPFEKERKRRVLIMKILISLLAVPLLGVVGIALLYFPKEGFIPIILIVGVILYHYIRGIYRRTTKKFKQKIKTLVLEPFLSIFDDVSKCSNALDLEFLNRTALFNFNAELTELDDCFRGSHNGVEFNVAEINDWCASGFRGVVLVLPSNKTIKGKTVITTKNDTNTEVWWGNKVILLLVLFISLAGVVLAFVAVVDAVDAVTSLIKGEALTQNDIGILGFTLLFILSIFLPKNKNIEKSKEESNHKNEEFEPSASDGVISIQFGDAPSKNIKLESVDWNKRFDVHSTDEVEGRYHVTTAFMERLLDLQTAFGNKQIKCAFYEDKVVFVIANNRDMFEFCNIFKRLDDPKQVEHLFDQFISIFRMIDHFKLDQKTGL